MTDKRTDDLIPPAPATRWSDPQAERQDAIQARQRSRAIVMAMLLGAFVVLVFAISIVKIQLGHG